MPRFMRTPSIWALLLSATLALSIACADRTSTEQPPAANRDAPEQTHPETPEPEGTAGRPAPSENATPNFEPARPTREPSASPASEPPTVVPEPVAEPAPPAAAQKAAGQQKAPAKDPIVLIGSPMGGVSFSHKTHVQHANNKCETCHHPSKPEKPLASPNQACRDCHTKTPAPPMKTPLQAAFHVPMAKSGTCIDCHQTAVKQGKKAPLKCQECHKKAIK